jgi:hypothetical protein
MSIIPKHKTGNCSQCGDKDVPCVKVGKELFCLYNCHRNNKAKQQIGRASERNKVRALPHVSDNQKELAENRNNLIEELDIVTSRIVRIMASDNKGYLNCYICGTKVHFTMADNMHFISRSHMGLRFDIRFNLRAGCKNCNQYLSGNLIKYAEQLEKEQVGLVEQLKERGREVEKIGTDELKQLLIERRARLKIIEQKLKSL